MTLTVFAPAKINLSLRVGPPGLDGRHPLDSLVAFTNTCGDTLELSQADHLNLQIIGPFGQVLSMTDDNLVLRAAALLQDHVRSKQGASIILTKSLPIASGIGGGSADAAAALFGLNQLWGSGADIETLQRLGATLGADVPACVLGAALRMTGTGETTQAVPPLPKLGIVLVNPLVPCPTGPVYQKYDQLGAFADPQMAPLPPLKTTQSLLDYLRATPNDLEAPAIALVPQIGSILSAIGTTKDILLTRMSGSGATCFGLYANVDDAKFAAANLKIALASSPIWVEADEIN
jgi:4-diphosphocytidyl-2-C-methyl-D-erythritol kinase